MFEEWDFTGGSIAKQRTASKIFLGQQEKEEVERWKAKHPAIHTDPATVGSGGVEIIFTEDASRMDFA